jgi:glutathione S-transferase
MITHRRIFVPVIRAAAQRSAWRSLLDAAHHPGSIWLSMGATARYPISRPLSSGASRHAPSRPPLVKLYTTPWSYAAVTTTLMLKHKRIPFEQMRMVPGLHGLTMLALGFESIGEPAVRIMAMKVQGSRWIARALDEVVSDRPLLPRDRERRREVERAERWGVLFEDAMRRLFLCAARRDASVLRAVAQAHCGPAMRAALTLSAPIAVRLAAAAHDASDCVGREALMLLPERLRQIDAWIEEGILNGDQLNAADFQIAPTVASLLHSQDLWPYVEGRPAAALARRVLPAGLGPRTRVAPPEWLAADGGGRKAR